MRQKPDFSAETLVVPLPQAFYYKGPADQKPHIVTAAKIRRLYAPDLSKVGKSINDIRAMGGSSMNFVLASKDILDYSVVEFYNSAKEVVTSGSIPLLVGRLPLTGAYKLVLFTIMLVRETSYMPTAYKCSQARCGKTTIFDLDPEIEVPKNIERERTFMEDFMDFYKERPDKRHSKTFEYKFQSPYAVEGLELDEPEEPTEEGKTPPAPKDTSVKMYRWSVQWPCLQDYVVALTDQKRQNDVELWVVYDNIRTINDFTEEQTEELKQKNGFDRIMRMKATDMRGIVEAMNQFGLDIDHYWDCVHCGTRNHSPFDFTNFYESLTNTR